MKSRALIAFMMAVVFVFVGSAVLAQPEAERAMAKLYEAAKKEGEVVSYDTGPEWANWKEMFKVFQQKFKGVHISYNDLGSGTTVARLEKEKANPQADTAYYSFVYGEIAKRKGLTQGFKPVNFDKIPPELKDPEGHWFTIHMGTVSFTINRRLVKRIPRTWDDLLRPEYKGMIEYLDPRTTGIGHAVILAASVAHGGSETNCTPGIEFLAKLQKIGNIKNYESTVETAKFLKGEIPIWIGYDFNGYKAIYQGGADAVVVIPRDGTITVPYVISMVKGAPHPNAAKLWLSFILSYEGQQIFSKGFVRPVVPGVEFPKEVKDKFLPPEDYAVAKNINWGLAMKYLDQVKREWGQKVLGE